MSEEIGVLRIDLTLDQADFTRSVQQIDTKLRALNSEFRASAAGNRDYERTLEGLRAKNEMLGNTLQLQRTKVDQLRAEYERVAEAKGRNSVEAEKLATKYNNAVAAMRRTEQQIGQVARAMQQQESQWQNATTNADRYAETLEKTSHKIRSFGDNAQSLGNKLSVGVTAPLAAFGVAAGVAAKQFDDAGAKIQMSLGATAQEAKNLEANAKNLWKDGFGESLEEVTDALIKVKQNMKGIADGKELEKVTRDAMLLANTFESDVNEVTRAANNLMVNFGIDSKKAFDLLAFGAQNGLNFSGELFDNVAEYSGLFKTLGFEADEYFQVLINGSKEGVYNLDYLNDVVKEFGIRIKDGSASTTDAIAQLFAPEGIDQFINSLEKAGTETEEFRKLAEKVGNSTAKEMVENLRKGGKSFEDTTIAIKATMGEYDEFFNGLSDGSLKGSDAMQMVIEKIQALDDPTERATLGVALFGTKWEDLEETAMFGLTAVSNEIENATGTMAKMAEVQDKTFGQRWNEILRTSQTALLPLGETLLDVAEEWLPKISVGVEKVTGWFNELSPSAKNTAVAIGGIALAAGPLITGFGFIASGIGSIIPLGAPLISILTGAGAAAGTAAGGAGLLGGALSVLTGPVGLAVAGVAALTAGGVALYKNWDTIIEKNPRLLATIGAIAPPVVLAVGAIKTLEEAMSPAIEKVDLFGEGVSGATKKALGGYLELSDGVTQTLSEVYLTSTRVTDEIATSMITKYAEMNTQIIEGMKTRHQEELSELENFFLNSSALTSAEEEKIVANRQMRNEREIEQQNFMFQRIKEITEKAATENRQLTERENEIINNYNKMMKENAVRTFSESELEQKVILERMKENASKISAEQAAEVVKNAVKQKDEVIKEANQTYEKSLAEIIKMRDETGDITAEQAEKMISEAKKARDQTIKLAEEQHQKIVSEAKKQAGEHVEQVNWETGEVLKKWEVFKNNAAKTWENMKSSADKWFSEIGKSISTNIDKAVKWAGDGVEKIKGFFKNLSLKIPKIELPKMPKFSLETSTKTIFGKEITYPSGLDVKWNAKGGIFDKPTIFATANAGLQGVGEAGAEAIAPIDTLLGYVRTAVAETMALNQVNLPSTIVVKAIMNDRLVGEGTAPFVSQKQHNAVSIAGLMKGVYTR